MVVYDITNEKSFKSVSKWIKQLKEYAEPDLSIMLVGTKLDLVAQNASRRKVPKDKAALYAEKNGLLFEETSSVASKNVNEAFENLLQDIYEKKSQMTADSDNDQSIHLRSYSRIEEEKSCFSCGNSN